MPPLYQSFHIFYASFALNTFQYVFNLHITSATFLLYFLLCLWHESILPHFPLHFNSFTLNNNTGVFHLNTLLAKFITKFRILTAFPDFSLVFKTFSLDYRCQNAPHLNMTSKIFDNVLQWLTLLVKLGGASAFLCGMSLVTVLELIWVVCVGCATCCRRQHQRSVFLMFLWTFFLS